MEGSRIPKKILYMNLERTRLKGRPFLVCLSTSLFPNSYIIWQDEVREDRRIVGGKGWKERLYDREK
jgi:hypothetical protein